MPLQKFTVSRDDSIYEAFPDVVLTNNGKLICVFLECKHHIDRSYTRIVLTESTDRGRSWSSKKPLVKEQIGFPFWDGPRISRLRNGNLVIICDSVKDYGYRRDEICANSFLWFGDTEGLQWDGPYETPVGGIVPDRICELPSGRWTTSTHVRNMETGRLESMLWYSDDKGHTWSDPVLIGSHPGLDLCEATILPLPDGMLVAFIRENSLIGLDCFKAISRDQGETWEGVYNVPIPACHRPVSGILKSGKIMITHRYHHGGVPSFEAGAQNFFAALMDMEYAKETKRNNQWVRIMPIDYDRSLTPDTGYSGWVQFADGEIYIVNYIVDDAPNAQIRGYSLTEEDFYIARRGL